MISPDATFQEIHDSLRPKILRYLIRLIGPQEAEDLTQETFVKVSNAQKDFRGEAQISTWIYRIATNLAMDRMRSPTFRQRTKANDLLDGAQGKMECSLIQLPPVEQQAIRKEMNECIDGFVQKLPEPYRAVLVLSEYEGMSNTRIAEVLGLSLETVKIRLHRARHKMKELLEENCRFYRDSGNELACDRKLPFPPVKKSS